MFLCHLTYIDPAFYLRMLRELQLQFPSQVTGGSPTTLSNPDLPPATGLHLLSAGFAGFGHAPETSDGSERSSSPPSPSPPQHSPPPLMRVLPASHSHLLHPSSSGNGIQSLQQKLSEAVVKQQHRQQHGTTDNSRNGGHAGPVGLATPPGGLGVHQLGARFGALAAASNSNNFSIRALLGLNTEAFTCHVCQRQFR